MWALVPIKSFAQAKQRLSPVLGPGERAGLARAMAEDVLGAIRGCPGIARATVVSVDADAQAIARRHGVEFLAEPAQSGGLNASVKLAVEEFRAGGAAAIIIVHGDLPMLTSAELGRIVASHSAQQGPCVTAVPDRFMDGTNVLAWRPLDGFRAQYGPASFQRHRDQARRLGATLNVLDSVAASLDIDVPADLLALIRGAREGQARVTRQYLERTGIARRLAAGEPQQAFAAIGMNGG